MFERRKEVLRNIFKYEYRPRILQDLEYCNPHKSKDKLIYKEPPLTDSRWSEAIKFAVNFICYLFKLTK